MCSEFMCSDLSASLKFRVIFRVLYLTCYIAVSFIDYLCHTMRFIQHTTLILSTSVSVYASLPLSCQDLCNSVPECLADPGYHGSYCKDWQTIPVCFGMYTRLDGSLCFQPNDVTCDDITLPAVGCSSVIVTTTLAPTTLAPTTTETTLEPTTPVETTASPTTESPSTAAV